VDAGGRAFLALGRAALRGVSVELVASRAASFGAPDFSQRRSRLACSTARKERIRSRLTRSVVISSRTSPPPQRYITVASVSGTHARRRATPSGWEVGVPCTLPTTRYGPTSASTSLVCVCNRRAVSPRGPLATTAQSSSRATVSSGIETIRPSARPSSRASRTSNSAA